jgi:hypothetical protein
MQEEPDDSQEKPKKRRLTVEEWFVGNLCHDPQVVGCGCLVLVFGSILGFLGFVSWLSGLLQ